MNKNRRLRGAQRRPGVGGHLSPPPTSVAPGELSLGVNLSMQFELVR